MTQCEPEDLVNNRIRKIVNHCDHNKDRKYFTGGVSIKSAYATDRQLQLSPSFSPQPESTNAKIFSCRISYRQKSQHVYIIDNYLEILHYK